jgi:DNA repair exonuclease SbcCD ATPase subunit
MSYKFVHLADVHWRGLSRHSEYRSSFEDAFCKMRRESPDAIFVVGDIVHSKTQGISPELISNLTWWFRELDSIAPTFVSLGNHDGLITNPDREDAVSPILNALELSNMTLLKGSQKLHFDTKLDISNFCPFDVEGWKSIGPTDGRLNLALFHGPVGGSQSDDGWELEGEVDIEFFKDYDFVMLGDIHKRQTLDVAGRILYCGSTIQQNYGETPNKGFSVWEIRSSNDFKHRHVEVAHCSPFVTLDWQGTTSELLADASVHPDGARFRVRTSKSISQTDIKQLHAALREQKSATEIVFKSESAPEADSSELEAISLEKLNTKDPKFIAELVIGYPTEASLNDGMKSKVVEQVLQYCDRIAKMDGSANGRWSIRKLEFDNTFGYGKGNIIDFSELDGITGIFGQNRVGKSSVCGTLMYSLFNSTDRGSMPNLHVINTRKGHCEAKLTLEKNDKLYRIERQTARKENRKGEQSGVTSLNFFEVDSEGNVLLDLCDEQRRETDKVVRDVIGTADDFLLTSFAAQGEMNTFIEQKATVRKNILSRFLELEVFDQINEMVKADSQSVRSLIKSAPSRDFDFMLLAENRKLSNAARSREDFQERATEIRESIKRLELSIMTRSDSGKYTSEEVTEQETKLKEVQSLFNAHISRVDELSSSIEDLNAKIEKIEELRSNFPIEDLKESLRGFRELETRIMSVKHDADKEKQKQKILAKQIEVLDEVPCGDNYPTCPFITDAHKAKSSLKLSNRNLGHINTELDELKHKFSKNSIKDLEAKLEKYDEFIGKHNRLKLEKSNLETRRAETKTRMSKLEADIKSMTVLLEEMRLNVSTDESLHQLKKIRQELNSLKQEESRNQSEIVRFSEEIGLAQSNIKKLEEDRKILQDAMEQFTVYDIIQQATSRNGVPLSIIRKRLPEINAEIASILQNVAGFTVELESPDGSNDMEVFINYGDSRRIIECGSGMEKMMSSLAIRVALSNVSQLPKSDLFIIDEGFGALDANNVEACNRFLESLKKWFRCILVISHVDAVKDAVDNVIVIERKGDDAMVRTT